MTDQSEWWCALCPTSHPTRDALDSHTVATHPATTGSTSAQLRQAQTALAASQADLTRVERALDGAQSTITELAALYESACNETARVERERGELAADLDAATGHLLLRDGELVSANGQRDLARAELVTANAELEHKRENAEIRARVVREKNAEITELRAELDRWRSGAQPNTEGAPPACTP